MHNQSHGDRAGVKATVVWRAVGLQRGMQGKHGRRWGEQVLNSLRAQHSEAASRGSPLMG